VQSLLTEDQRVSRLGEAPVSVGLVVTVGLFVGLIGLAQRIWPPEPRVIPFLLPHSGVDFAGA
jgi:branched-chain amino acid transport system permease protein